MQKCIVNKERYRETKKSLTGQGCAMSYFGIIKYAEIELIIFNTVMITTDIDQIPNVYRNPVLSPL